MGNKIRETRKKEGLTQESVARMADITLNSFQNIEANRQTPSVITALKIAKALNCKVEDLYFIED